MNAGCGKAENITTRLFLMGSRPQNEASMAYACEYRNIKMSVERNKELKIVACSKSDKRRYWSTSRNSEFECMLNIGKQIPCGVEQF